VCRMIAGGNWWRANEIDIRHLTRRTETRYCSRDKALGGDYARQAIGSPPKAAPHGAPLDAPLATGYGRIPDFKFPSRSAPPSKQ